VLAVFGLLVSIGPLAWLALDALRKDDTARIVSNAGPVASARTLSERKPPALFIARAGGRVPALEYLHAESSYSRTGIVRSVGVAPPRPSEVKSYPDATKIALPAPRTHAGVAFGPPRSTSARDGQVVSEAAPVTPALGDVAELCHFAAGVTSKNPAAGLWCVRPRRRARSTRWTSTWSRALCAG
jgi:hypothetical protein